MSVSCPNSEKGPAFCLLWTVGFSGKRFFEADEKKIAGAIKEAVNFLCVEARNQDAQLTAVSSLARGGDVLFAETVLHENACGVKVQWKCLLPFEWETFLQYDLAQDAEGSELARKEFLERSDRARVCYRGSTPEPLEVGSKKIHVADKQQRDEAYLDCGYRTVDEADVMIFLLRRSEIEQLRAGTAAVPNRPGTLAVALYAAAAKRPMILLPVDAPDPWAAKEVMNDPSGLWFVDPMVTDVVRRAKAVAQVPAPPEYKSECRKSVWSMQWLLGRLADTHQKRTMNGLRRILRLHLCASALAAFMATAWALPKPNMMLGLLVAFVMLAFTKPILAFSAWWWEHHLHNRGNRQDWIHARVLAELCRGALATWPLPIQPLDAHDEEDFPKVKRLIRSLRLLREQDAKGPVSGTQPLPSETQLEADMRLACDDYIKERLNDQADYYAGKLLRARREGACWRYGFMIATGVAIVLGLTVAVNKIPWALGSSHLIPAVEHWLEAFVIIAPFLAAHCLGMMTILDCRRRENRYEEMRHYLSRIGDTLKKTHSNSSRVRLIEHAERMMIEEQHEWFSVMRNLSV